MEPIERYASELDAVMQRIGSRFVRSEARQRAQDYVKGLFSSAERKNSWQLAEAIGDATPYGLQQFLYRAEWDADAVRDDLRDYVIEHLADAQAVLIVDETGFLKKGTHSAGVQRQYSGTAGRIENCQIGVFLAYTSVPGYAFLDRRLYLPEDWANDRARCQQAGIPDSVEFATKPNLAWQMLQQAVAHRVPFAWVTADSIYGDYRRIRVWLESLPRGYVLAISAKEYVNREWRQDRVGAILADLPQTGWRRLSAGDGAKGPRLYEWLRLPLIEPLVKGWKRWLLVRRRLSDPTDLTAYACFAPARTPLVTLVQVAGRRWAIEAAFEEAKGEVGLDQYEVRSWTGWHRHITLACLAHALLKVVRTQAQRSTGEAQKGGRPVQPKTNGQVAFSAR